ncbi:MAG: stage II sporulation protein M [Acidobacteriota bacterium]|nr:stage II sporulation protein M [Acidobacteriota bacterium]
MLDKFINKRKNNWQRLEDLLSLTEAATLRGLNREEIRELGQLYRRAASDLAIARAESRDPKLVNYLNSLVIRAHGQIYRAENQGFGLIKSFFLRDFPQTFRQTWKFTAISFLTFLLSAALAFVATWQNIDFADTIGTYDVRYEVESGQRWWLELNKNNQIGSAAILTNNIMVTFYAFSYGAFFALGTLYIIGMNGAFLGSIFAICYQFNPSFGNDLLFFVVAHGVIELSCIFICGGAGMMIGYSILVPGDLSRIEALKKSGVEAVKIVVGCAFLLVIAGIIEGFISPAGINPAAKVGIGLTTGIAMYSYLLFAGRSTELEQPPLLDS